VKTYAVKSSDVKRDWYVINAEGKTLGRLATEIAKILHGKHKPIFAPHLDTGDYVVVVNAALVRATGRKMSDKMYYRHSGYPGGLRSVTLGEILADHPTRALYFAVRGMLPKNRLGRQIIKKLKIYAGAEHPGTGDIVINGKPLNEYCSRESDRQLILRPLRAAEMADKFSVIVKVFGGGVSGQAGAISHGISRALTEADPNLRETLRRAGLLTRDPRAKERKKPGLKRARKAPQYTKR